ncbi:hypothetical protein D9M68_655720 [compost metagenome]
MPRALGTHLRQDRAGHFNSGEEIELELRTQLAFGELFYRAHGTAPSHIGQHIDSAETLDRSPHRTFACSSVGDVQLQRQCMGFVAAGQLPQTLQAASTEDHVVTTGNHGLSQGHAETGRSTSDKPNFLGLCHGMFSWDGKSSSIDGAHPSDDELS